MKKPDRYPLPGTVIRTAEKLGTPPLPDMNADSLKERRCGSIGKIAVVGMQFMHQDVCWVDHEGAAVSGGNRLSAPYRWEEVEIVTTSAPALAMTFFARAGTEATEAVWLTAGKQTAKRASQLAIKAAGKKLPPGTARWLRTQLDTDTGLAFVAVGIGTVASMLPKVTASPRRARLALAMRVWGMHVLSDGIINPILDIFVDTLDEVLIKVDAEGDDEP